MIVLVCGTCGNALRVRDELAGTRVKCSGCGSAVGVAKPDSDSDVVACEATGATDPTLPPPDQGHGNEESLPSSDERTSGEGVQNDNQTRTLPGSQQDLDLLYFLAPAQKPDE